MSEKKLPLGAIILAASKKGEKKEEIEESIDDVAVEDAGMDLIEAIESGDGQAVVDAIRTIIDLI